MNEERYREAEDVYWTHYGVGEREERLVDLPTVGGRARVQIVGDGPPIVFVHGGPNAGTTWAPVVAELREQFRCYVLDRPGCGLSPAVDYNQADFKSVARGVLRDLLDGLGLERAHLVASSLGAAWTLWFAASDPDRVDRVVVMSAPAFMPDASPSSYAFLRLLSLPVIGAMLCHLPQTRGAAHATFRNMGHGALLDGPGFPDAFYVWGKSMGSDTDTMRNDRRAIQRAMNWGGADPELLLNDELFRSIPHRTHWFWGTADPFGTVDGAKRAVEQMPNATLELFEDGGHLPWLDDPARAAAAVRATFLAQKHYAATAE